MPSDDMSMQDALILLHGGIDRQGPGDDRFSLGILRKLPDLPPKPVIADLGCGTGTASMLLAQHFGQSVLCVDTSAEFLQTLDARASERDLAALVETHHADMGTLDSARHRFDLLWSEGAAYNLTFDGAMKSWRPLMAENGIAVVSELSWFGSERPGRLSEFWRAAYPEMADEAGNRQSAEKHGFTVLFTERLPVSAWWENYYDPLQSAMDTLASHPSETLRQVIAGTSEEIALFREFSDFFGYTFYVLQADSA